MLEQKIENVSFDEAKELAKKKGLDIAKIQKEEDPVERYVFYDKQNTLVAAYFPIKRFFLCSPPPTYKKDTPEFQRFAKNLIRRRFPDRPDLLNTTIRRYTEGEMPSDTVAFVGGAHKLGAEVVLDRSYRIGDPDLKHTITHELVHKRREMDSEENLEGDKEEIETELETIQRKGIVDLKFTDDAGYWLMLGGNWRNLQKQDYRTLTGRDAPRSYDACREPVTSNIIGNISARKAGTNLWDIIRSGKLEEEQEHEGKMFPTRKKIRNPENIDTSFITSEGDKYHFFSPSGRAKPRQIAKFIDKADGITGEEDVWQIMDVGKKLLIFDKATPDRIVKKQKKKHKVLNMFPQFRKFEFPTINVTQKSIDTKTITKKKKLKKNLMNDILGFKFFN